MRRRIFGHAVYLDGVSIPRVLAGLCAVAGVLVLAGLGWALLTAAAILFLAPVSPGLLSAPRRIRDAAAAVWRWLAGGRQAVAAASTPVAIIGLAVGISLAVGVGWGVAVACVVIIALALQVDRAG